MEISSTLAATPAATQSRQSDSGPAISSDFETFLRMLTVQMQNQDPLNPIKSEDFAVQLATFSGVEQQVRTNDLLEGLGSQMGLGGMTQAAGWVGMEARTTAGGYFDGAPLTVFPKPDTSADQAFLIARDAVGAEVQRMQISVSNDPVQWSGSTPAGVVLQGAYRFEVESYSNGALSSTRPVEVYSRVTEARIQDGGTVLVLQGGIEVSTADVTGLREVDSIS